MPRALLSLLLMTDGGTPIGTDLGWSARAIAWRVSRPDDFSEIFPVTCANRAVPKLVGRDGGYAIVCDARDGGR